MSRGVVLALLVIAVIRGGVVQPSLAFTTVPLRVNLREKARNARSDVALARVASDRGYLLPEDSIYFQANETANADMRLIAIQGEYHARLAHQEASHRREMAEQRVKLLEGMVPRATHEVIVDSYERRTSEYIAESMAANAASVSTLAADFTERQRGMQEQIEVRDASLVEAEANLCAMSGSLGELKRDVGSLRAALRTEAHKKTRRQLEETKGKFGEVISNPRCLSAETDASSPGGDPHGAEGCQDFHLSRHAARAEEARRTLALEIRQKEVAPQKQRADRAENELAELRRATLDWMSAECTSKTEAAAEARAEGYLEGRADAEADAAVEVATLRVRADETHEAFRAHRERSREERLALREAIAEAREEGFAMVASLGQAGAAAIESSHQAGKAQGYAEGLDRGRDEAKEELLSRLRETEASTKAAEENETEMRDAFAAYIVRAHEEKLELMAKERAAAKTRMNVVMEKLAEITSALARMLQERIEELEAKRDATFASETGPLPTSPVVVTDKDSSILGEIGRLELSDSSQPFWQECGGAQK